MTDGYGASVKRIEYARHRGRLESDGYALASAAMGMNGYYQEAAILAWS